MRLYQYINELAMRKKTVISSPKYKEKSMYEQTVTLEDGLQFKFICYYFSTADIWEVTFEDENEYREKAPKRKGAAVELFAALEKVFKQFLEKALPDRFRFLADIDEKSRIKLYDLLAKKISKLGFDYKKKQSTASMVYYFKHKSLKHEDFIA